MHCTLAVYTERQTDRQTVVGLLARWTSKMIVDLLARGHAAAARTLIYHLLAE